MPLVALVCAYDIWRLWGDRSVSVARVFLHTLTRGLVLGGVAFAVYVGVVGVHFALLPLSGPGDAFMSLSFQVVPDCWLVLGYVLAISNSI